MYTVAGLTKGAVPGTGNNPFLPVMLVSHHGHKSRPATYLKPRLSSCSDGRRSDSILCSQGRVENQLVILGRGCRRDIGASDTERLL